MPDKWNPELYERFESERSRPFYDLVDMIHPQENLRVLDLGCGTGKLTKYLHDTLAAQVCLPCPIPNPQSPMKYIIFYKPYGVLSQFTKDAPTHSTLKDYIDVPDVYPVGRLDWDSEGLLLLTNDGQLQHRLAHPRFGHKRTYWVQVERIPDADAIQRLQTGVEIQDYRTQPAEVRLLPKEPQLPERTPPIRFRKNVPTAWLEMTLTEGKNRQVRRMTAAVGFPTLRLVRVSIAHLQLDDLQLGQWRDLTTSELQFLHNFGKSKTFSPKTIGLTH